VTFKPRVWRAIAILVLATGCTRFRPPAPGRFPGSDRALIRGFIKHVVDRESSVHNMRARTKFTIDSPDLDRSVTLRGFVAFAAPDKLRVQGHAVFGIDACDLISVGPTFYLHIPSQDKVFYEQNGVAVDGMPFSVSPSDIVQEMFGPFSANKVRAKHVRVLDRGDDESVFECTVGSTRHVAVVDNLWRVLRRVRYDNDKLTSSATMTDYEETDGILFPHNIELIYPARNTSLTMELSGIQINGDLNPELFRLPAVAPSQKEPPK
jgi:hypothetical protein